MLCLLFVWSMQLEPNFQFTDVTESAGFIANHGYDDLAPSEPRKFSGGAAIGDVDRDGWLDVYILIGQGGGLLYRNQGDGTFMDTTREAGLHLPDLVGCGPALVDVDGDGDLDLFIGGLEGTGPRLLRNRGDGTFEPFPNRGGFAASRDTVAATFADIDDDGDLDAFLSHWSLDAAGAQDHLWENDGTGQFRDISDQFQLDHYESEDFSFAPQFADFDNNGQLDILTSGDFGTSKIMLAPDYRVDTRTELTDEHGMGSALGDVDNDGDLDWFITSIWDPQPGQPRGWTGNRLYRNDGDGTFTDITTTSLRQGYWGWGAAFADFNNDGWLDLVHTNGWFGELAEDFLNDPSRFFLNNGEGGLIDASNPVNLNDNDQGRGVLCFDYDRDGDLDLLVVNGFGRSTLYRNDGGNQANWLQIEVAGNGGISQGLGYRVYVEAAGTRQMRAFQSGSNYAAHGPARAHFGLGDATAATVEVVWREHSDQERRVTVTNVSANQAMVIRDNGRTMVAEHPWRMRITLPPTALEHGEIAVVSAASTTGSLFLQGYDELGQPTDRTQYELPSMGVERVPMTSGLPLADGGTTWIELSADVPFSAALTGMRPQEAFAVAASQHSDRQLVVPHIAKATADFFTQARLANTGDDELPVQLLWTDDNQAPMNTLPSHASLAIDFNPAIETLPATWQGIARVNTTPDSNHAFGALTGIELFGYQHEDRLAALGLHGQLAQRLVFAHIADPQRNWWTGLAVVNQGETSATVQWQAFTADGNLAASGQTTLSTGEKRTALIDGNAAGESLFGSALPAETAWVQMDADQPMAGYTLFGSRSGQLFAGLEAHRDALRQLAFPAVGNAQIYAALALVNSLAASQTVTIQVRDTMGVIVATEELTLAPFARQTLLTSALFPDAPNDSYILVTAPRGIYGFQLTGDRQSTWLTGLEALPHPLGLGTAPTSHQ